MNRTVRSIKNFIWEIVNRAVSLILPFIIRSVISYKIGVEYLGLHGLFSSILQVLSLAELGIADAIVYCMYKPISEGNSIKINAILSFFKKIYYCIGTVILLAGIAVLPFLDYIIESDCPSDVDTHILFFIYLLNTAVSYFFFGYKEAVLKAYHRNDVSSKIMALCNLMMYGIQILILCTLKNYYFYIIAMPIMTVIINLVRSICVKRMFPDIICSGSLGRDEKAEIAKNVYGISLNKIAHTCRNSFDSIIISASLGLVSLARYQNYYYVVSALGILTGTIISSVCGGIGNSIAKDSIEKNMDNYFEFLYIYSFIAAVAASCMMCLQQRFILLWVGEDHVLPFGTVVCCGLYFMVLRLGDVTATYRQATGGWWVDRYRPIVESAANLILNVLMVKQFGINGVMIATIITIVFINIPWATIVLFKNYFHFEAGIAMRRMIRYFFLAVVSCAVSLFVIRILPVDMLLIRLFVPAVFSIIFMIVPNMRTPEYHSAKLRVTNIIRYAVEKRGVEP